MMAFAFKKLRPIFRERGKIKRRVTGRLGETLGGIRIVKAYTRGGARGARVLRQRGRPCSTTSRKSITAVSGVSASADGDLRRRRRPHDPRRRARRSSRADDARRLRDVHLLHRAGGGTARADRLDPHAAQRGLRRSRPHPRDPQARDGGRDDDEQAPLASLRGDVRFEDVFFEYEAGVPVLKDISFEAPAGTTTALVGSSGSGKSTLVSLVLAFNRPLSRDGSSSTAQDLATIRLGDYRAHIGVVLQDNFLFDGTIAENIAYSRPEATRGRDRERRRVAHCDEFVSRFENGYDTVVGERGVKLTGGQRQRVAIARAILADPRILILDEATSSLDSESEAMIQDGLRRLAPGRTTFVIAHRLSTIVSADQILVLEGGRDRRARHPRGTARRRAAATGSSTTASTGSRPIASSTRARTSPRSPRPPSSPWDARSTRGRGCSTPTVSTELLAKIRDIPKVELHLHLEGAIPLPALWELVKKYGGSEEAPTLGALEDEVPLPRLSPLPRDVDVEERLSPRVRRLHLSRRRGGRGSRSPEHPLRRGVPLPGRLRHAARSRRAAGDRGGTRRGLDAHRDRIEVKLIADLDSRLRARARHGWLRELARRSPMEIVGIGIGGSEHAFPPEPYARRLRGSSAARASDDGPRRRRRREPRASGGRFARSSVDRIGHGTRAVEDPELVRYLKEKRVSRSRCAPCRTSAPASSEASREHPIRTVLRRRAARLRQHRRPEDVRTLARGRVSRARRAPSGFTPRGGEATRPKTPSTRPGPTRRRKRPALRRARSFGLESSHERPLNR